MPIRAIENNQESEIDHKMRLFLEEFPALQEVCIIEAGSFRAALLLFQDKFDTWLADKETRH